MVRSWLDLTITLRSFLTWVILWFCDSKWYSAYPCMHFLFCFLLFFLIVFFIQKNKLKKKIAHENITPLADIPVFSHKASSVLFQTNLKHKLTMCNKLSFVWTCKCWRLFNLQTLLLLGAVLNHHAPWVHYFTISFKIIFQLRYLLSFFAFPLDKALLQLFIRRLQPVMEFTFPFWIQ